MEIKDWVCGFFNYLQVFNRNSIEFGSWLVKICFDGPGEQPRGGGGGEYGSKKLYSRKSS